MCVLVYIFCMCLCIGQREGTSESETKCFLFSKETSGFEMFFSFTYKKYETEYLKVSNTSGHQRQTAFILLRELSLIFLD